MRQPALRARVPGVGATTVSAALRRPSRAGREARSRVGFPPAGRAMQREGSARPEANPGSMRRLPVTFPEFERVLLRKGISSRSAGSPRCHDCRRTPLIGEHLYRYDDGRQRCELCRSVCRETPLDSELVRSSEQGQTVRLTIRAA